MLDFDAKVLADSISPQGKRLITFQVTFPRPFLAEVNTHRRFSRNSASSRAIPTEKLVANVQDKPFIPEFCKRVKGMGFGEPLKGVELEEARHAWLQSRDAAMASALALVGTDKSSANRLLEPFMWHTAIITSSEWDNWFALRAPVGDEVTSEHGAAREVQRIAIMMRQVGRESTPVPLRPGQWHLPLVSDEEISSVLTEDDLCMLSAGRCARVSYDTHENYEPVDRSLERADSLLNNGHMSPFEHQATPMSLKQIVDHANGELRANLSGNLSGDWIQYRKTIPNEWNLVGHLEGRSKWDE